MSSTPSLPASSAPPAGRRWSWVVLLGLAILPFLNTLSNDLVGDDRALVIENPVVRSLDPGAALRPGLGRYAVEWYRPLTLYSLAVNYRAGGRDPVGYHAVNLLLHLGCVLLVYSTGRKILTHPGTALIAAALFAVHPLHVEAIAPVSGRADLLATFLVLLVWNLALGDRPVHRPRAVVVGVLAFFALLAKEHAIIGWPIVALCDLTGVGGVRRPASTPLSRLSARARIHQALALAVGGYLMFRFAMAGGLLAAGAAIRPIENPLTVASVATRIATAGWVLVKYCALLIAPAGLSADYSFNQIPLVNSWSDPRLAATVLLAVALGAAIVAAWPRQRTIAILLAWFLVSWLPVSNLILVIGTVMAERLMYLPSVAFVLLVGATIDATRSATTGGSGLRTGSPGAHPRQPGPGFVPVPGPKAPAPDRLNWVVPAAATTLVVTCVALTFGRIRVWRSEETLFADTARQSPQSAKAHFNYGTALLERNRFAEASREFTRAIQIAPEYPEAHNGRGAVLLGQRQLREAENEFREAIRIEPGLASAWINLGLTLFRATRDEEAEVALRQAVVLGPTIAIAHASLGAIAERRGLRTAAITEYLKAYRLEPRFAGLAPHLIELLNAEGSHGQAADIARESQQPLGFD